MTMQILPIHSLDNRYLPLKELGDGSFGDVWLAMPLEASLMVIPSMPHGAVAVKTLKETCKQLLHYSYFREVDFLRNVPQCPYLVRTYEVFIDTNLLKCHVVMESMDMNLWQFMEQSAARLKLSTLRRMLYQVVKGLAHIHSYGYYHRDVKPENVLVKKFTGGDVQLKLADFGLSRHYACKDPYTSYVSTRWYRAPELLLKCGQYSFGIDIWAFGVLSAELATMRPLFPGDSELQQLEYHLTSLGSPRDDCFGGPWPSFEKQISKLGLDAGHFPGIQPPGSIIDYPSSSFCNMISQCLKWDPANRTPAHELLKHSVFSEPCEMSSNYVCSKSNSITDQYANPGFTCIEDKSPYNVISANTLSAAEGFTHCAAPRPRPPPPPGSIAATTASSTISSTKTFVSAYNATSLTSMMESPYDSFAAPSSSESSPRTSLLTHPHTHNNSFDAAMAQAIVRLDRAC